MIKGIVEMAMRENRPTQDIDEVVGLCSILAEQKISVVLEVGLYYGGTMNIWSKIAPDDALLIGVDNEDRIANHQTHKPTQRFVKVLGDSTSKDTIEAVSKELDGKKADFLFLDGNHLYDYVKSDYINYRGFVKPGGIIAFHDTYGNDGVKRAIKEVAVIEEQIAQFATKDKPAKMGITVFRRGNA